MSKSEINRRTFAQVATMAVAASVLPSVSAWAQGSSARKRNVVIGHTGITWPGRAPGQRGGGAPPAPPDPALNETIFKDVSELGFAGLELFDWQIAGLESQGLLGQFVESTSCRLFPAIPASSSPIRPGARRLSRPRSTSARS